MSMQSPTRSSNVQGKSVQFCFSFTLDLGCPALILHPTVPYVAFPRDKGRQSFFLQYHYAGHAICNSSRTAFEQHSFQFLQDCFSVSLKRMWLGGKSEGGIDLVVATPSESQSFQSR
jgi:hypothetical protein